MYAYGRYEYDDTSKIGTKMRCVITCCVRGNVDENDDEEKDEDEEEEEMD